MLLLPPPSVTLEILIPSKAKPTKTTWNIVPFFLVVKFSESSVVQSRYWSVYRPNVRTGMFLVLGHALDASEWFVPGHLGDTVVGENTYVSIDMWIGTPAIRWFVTERQEIPICPVSGSTASPNQRPCTAQLLW